jgi:hypothetical protein
MKWGGYFDVSRTNVSPSVLQFKLIDTDGMAKRMRLTERALVRGQANHPATAEESLDSVEQEIVGEISGEGKTCHSTYLDHQKTYADRANHLGIHGLTFQLRAAADDLRTHFARELHTGKDELYAAKRHLQSCETELSAFKTAHRLTRPPRDQHSPVLSWGFIVLILALESLMNGYFLAKGSMFGFAGGVFTALIIAAINVLIGLVFGRAVFPWLGYKNIIVRSLAVLASLLYLACAVGFNLAVAHYRDAVAADPLGASVFAYHSLVADPFGIHDLECWALFLLGMFFSFGAAVDGYWLDDAYPGYGRRARQARQAIDDYADLKDELLGRLEALKRTAETKMDDTVHSIGARQTEADVIATQSVALRDALLEHFAHLEAAGNTLLRVYRDENARTRTMPAPAHFDVPWRYAYPSPDAAVYINKNRETTEQAVRTAMEAAPGFREAMNAAYADAMAEYKRIDELTDVGSIA